MVPTTETVRNLREGPGYPRHRDYSGFHHGGTDDALDQGGAEPRQAVSPRPGGQERYRFATASVAESTDARHRYLDVQREHEETLEQQGGGKRRACTMILPSSSCSLCLADILAVLFARCCQMSTWTRLQWAATKLRPSTELTKQGNHIFKATYTYLQIL